MYLSSVSAIIKINSWGVTGANVGQVAPAQYLNFDVQNKVVIILKLFNLLLNFNLLFKVLLNCAGGDNNHYCTYFSFLFWPFFLVHPVYARFGSSIFRTSENISGLLNTWTISPTRLVELLFKRVEPLLLAEKYITLIRNHIGTAC